MNPKLKKIIAREGIILIGILCFGFFYMYLGTVIKYLGLFKDTKAIPYYIFGCSWRDGAWVQHIGWSIIFFGYPAYLLIHFIIWAMKTLKVKEL